MSSFRAFITLALSVAMTIAGLPVLATSPISEVVCAPTQEMRDRLEGRMGEVRTGTGIRSPQQVMELWSRPSSGDWTLVVTYASGKSCIVAMGEGWSAVPLPG